MNTKHRRNALTLLALLIVAGIEFGCAHVRFGLGLRPLLVLPAVAMVTMVALVFMRIATGPTLARGFAIASLFWLTILLGLGMMDPMTRTVYPVQGDQLP